MQRTPRNYNIMQLNLWVKRHKANKAGKCPISLRITLNGRAEVSTELRIHPDQWDQTNQCIIGSTRAINTNNETLQELIADARRHRRELPEAERTAANVAARLRGTPPPAAVCLLEKAQAVLRAHYASRNVSTLQNFTRAVALLRSWHGAGPLSEAAFEPEARKRFLSWLLGEQALDPASVRTYLSGLSTLWARAGLLTERGRGPFAGLRLPRKVKVPRASLSKEQLHRLATGALPARLDEARRVYLACFYLHGSRIGVVLQLRWADVREGRVYYQAAKGGPHKSVALSGPLRALLGEPGEPGAFIFPYLPADYFARDKAGRHRAGHAANTMVNYYLKRACATLELPGNIHPHTARHTMARMTVEATGDIRAAQHVLGHATYRQTEIYVRSMLTDEVDAAAAAVYDSL